MTREEAVAITRQNTGKHFLDSGGAYGRAWQTPPDAEDQPLIYTGEDCSDVGVSTTQLLEDMFEINHVLTNVFEMWIETNEEACKNKGWRELLEEFLGLFGYDLKIHNNTYNWESDLYQDLVYMVFSVDDEAYNWTYNNNNDTFKDLKLKNFGQLWRLWLALEVDGDEREVIEDYIDSPGEYHTELPSRITVIQSHNGCDIRGGYSDPVIGNFEICEGILPDYLVEWYFEGTHGEGHLEPDGSPADLSAELAEKLNNSGEFGYGYSQNPTCHMLDRFTQVGAQDDDGKMRPVFENIERDGKFSHRRWLMVDTKNPECFVYAVPARPYSGE